MVYEFKLNTCSMYTKSVYLIKIRHVLRGYYFYTVVCQDDVFFSKMFVRGFFIV